MKKRLHTQFEGASSDEGEPCWRRTSARRFAGFEGGTGSRDGSRFGKRPLIKKMLFWDNFWEDLTFPRGRVLLREGCIE